MPWKMEMTDENKKNYVLSKISNKLLGYAAYRLKIEDRLILNPQSKNRLEWIKKLKKFPIKKFLNDLLPYYMSGRITTHLFVLEESSIKQLNKLIKEKKFENVLRIGLANFYPQFFKERNKKFLLIKMPSNKQLELIEKDGKIVLEEYLPFKNIWIIFHIKEGIIEVRTRSDYQALQIIERLNSELRISCAKITFTKEEMYSFFDWINNNFSNSHIRFQKGPISTATYTSATDEEGKRIPLTKVKEFLNAREKGDVVSIYAYIPENEIIKEMKEKSKEEISQKEINDIQNENDIGETSDALEVVGLIGFNINFTSGKIYFSSAISEFEVSEILKGILKLLDMKSKRKLSKPSPQTKFGPNGDLY